MRSLKGSTHAPYISRAVAHFPNEPVAMGPSAYVEGHRPSKESGDVVRSSCRMYGRIDGSSGEPLNVTNATTDDF